MRNRLPSLVRLSVVAHTLDGRSFAGVLVGVHRDAIALAHCNLLMENGQREALQGDVLIPRGNLSFLQADPQAEPQAAKPLEGLLG